MKRKAGMIFPLSGLPSEEGIGTLGLGTIGFLDFLKDCGFRQWQLLPLTIPDPFFSPYMSPCTMAGNPNYIDLRLLERQGLIKNYSGFHGKKDKVDFQWLKKKRYYLKEGFKHFKDKGDLQDFIDREKSWIMDFCSYQVLCKKYGADWRKWEEKYKYRDVEALKELEKEEAFTFEVFLQYIFYVQYEEIREEARIREIEMIGDLPYSCPVTAMEVWKNPEYFSLDKDGRILHELGAPPDLFSSQGQSWGSPCYNFKRQKEDDFIFWKERFGHMITHYDGFRVDHFRGYESYWSIPFGDKPKEGRRVKVPGKKLLLELEKEFGRLPIYVEDLGALTKEFNLFMKEWEYPGMNVLEFAFDGEDSIYLPHYHSKNSISISGTHDNPPFLLWWEERSKEVKCRIQNYFGFHEDEILEGLLRGVFSSVSYWAFIQLGDLLSKEDTFRINTPGTIGDNWIYRVDGDQLQEGLAKKVRKLLERYGRV
ncbi:MAG: 4-alpha-glucanotransferase [Tissierellia bacterium]|nr:4-alpha-glucanotransferase [Tissierellia bacterium]